MNVTVFAGAFMGGGDPVGVAPRNGPLFGVRYDVHMSTLVGLTGGIAMASTERALLDPTRAAGGREVGVVSHGLLLADAGLRFGLTGARSFHNLVPTASISMGVASDLQGRDEFGYALGMRFMFSVGAGVAWLVSPNWQVRADVTNHRFSVKYPVSFMVPSTDGSRAREGDGSRYTSNIALSAGVSYRFFR
jgi:hypothetical protein